MKPRLELNLDIEGCIFATRYPPQLDLPSPCCGADHHWDHQRAALREFHETLRTKVSGDMADLRRNAKNLLFISRVSLSCPPRLLKEQGPRNVRDHCATISKRLCDARRA